MKGRAFAVELEMDCPRAGRDTLFHSSSARPPAPTLKLECEKPRRGWKEIKPAILVSSQLYSPGFAECRGRLRRGDSLPLADSE